jgi:aminoglycoside 3-N-acetyltransferase
MPQTLTKQELIKSFLTIGIGQGTRLVVQSSLRSLGPVEGGADTVIDALLECIGPDGLLIMPTFTYNNAIFDPASTPGRTGILTEIFRGRPDTVRSLHPTYSVAAFGRDAHVVCDGHHLVPGLGKDSPLDRVAKSGGGVLLLGVGHTGNSTVHVGEAYTQVPYGDIPFSPEWPRRAHVTGTVDLEVELHDPPGCSRAFGSIEACLREKGAIRDGLTGKALVQWMRGQDVIDCTVAMLARDPAALLCSDPACYRCSRARERLGR